MCVVVLECDCVQADLGPSLQVFYNLQSLPPVIMDALNTVLMEAIDATKRAFDTHTLERSTTISLDLFIFILHASLCT